MAPASSPSSPAQDAIARLRAIRKREGLTQKEIEEGTGIDQGQLSRILRGESGMRAATLARLEAFLEKFHTSVAAEDVADNPILMSALANIWDGTDEHARAIAVVINALGALRN